MNPEKAEKLFSLMKQFGVEYFKNEKIEIKMAGVELSLNPVVKPEPKVETKTRKKVPPQQAVPVSEMTIPHHVNEAARLLKLNDNDLADALFPDGSKAVNDAHA